MKNKQLLSELMKKKRELINYRLNHFSRMSETELYEEVHSGPIGLETNQVETNRDDFGENVISQKEGDNHIVRFLKAYINPFTVILMILVIVSIFTDIVFSQSNDYSTIVIIVSMVVLSGTLRFFQETKSGKAAEKLKKMVNVTTNVIRAGKGIEIALKEVVVGDIITLTAGDMVPADMRIITAKDLHVSQSALTGESEPVEKLAIQSKKANPLECSNLVFLGTNVISGTATCLVASVGDDTFFGSMAVDISGKKVKTSFETGINSVSWILIRFMAIMVPVIFFVNGLTKGVLNHGGGSAWLDALLFGLAVAVGLTPEMLPMIVTTGLAKGAVKMAKQQVVVKSLNSIQNLGAIDVLCTDKTGTLTQDKVVLEHYYDIYGNESSRVLRHAFLNSFYQTGLKNLMDLAIINHSEQKDVIDLCSGYSKVDEIPFDFNRRRMSVVVEKNGKTQMITKGAVEEMISICSYVESNGQVISLTENLRKEIISRVSGYNDNGLRVLAVAQKTNPREVGVFSVVDEDKMVLIGFLAFMDPPKDSAASAIKALTHHGVKVKVLTGDNDAVSKFICSQVGIDVHGVILGTDIQRLSDQELRVVVEENSVFAKLSPSQKVRIVTAIRENDHVVGFMGDGINDAAAMKAADVGISVDSAVDIAKESADIILLEKDLNVLEKGIMEGRTTFGNIIKYIKMTASSNFGNMLSMLFAGIFLPFLPMLPLQLLLLNLIYDLSSTAIPWDHLDSEYIKNPRKWEANDISRFMLWMGSVSSIFDITTFMVMFFIVCPAVFGGQYSALSSIDQEGFVALFRSGWFVESLWTQTLVIHMIRTQKIPFVQSRASTILILFTTIGIAVGSYIPYSFLSNNFKMQALPISYYPWLLLTVVLYMGLSTIIKKIYVSKYRKLL